MALPGIHAITAPLKIGRQLNQWAGQRRSDHTLVSAIEKSALSGYADEDEGLYLVVLRDGEQLHHIMAGELSHRAMASETETTPRDSEGMSILMGDAILGTNIHSFNAYTSPFPPPFKPRHDIVPTSAVLPKNTIVFVTFLQVGADAVPFVEEADNNCVVSVFENICVAASKNGFMQILQLLHLAPTRIWCSPFLSGRF